MRKLNVKIYIPGRPNDDLLKDALKKTAALHLLNMNPLLVAQNGTQVTRLEKMCDEHDCAWLKDFIITTEVY